MTTGQRKWNGDTWLVLGAALESNERDRIGGALRDVFGATAISVRTENSMVAAAPQACTREHVVGVAAIGSSVHATGSPVFLSETAYAGLFDCAGMRWYYATGAAEGQSPCYFRATSAECFANFATSIDTEAIGKIIANLKSIVAQNPARARNFAKYGSAMDDTEARALYGLRTDDKAAGVVVNWLPPIGAAARAGLKLGQVVTAINGEKTRGLSADELARFRDTVPAT